MNTFKNIIIILAILIISLVVGYIVNNNMDGYYISECGNIIEINGTTGNLIGYSKETLSNEILFTFKVTEIKRKYITINEEGYNVSLVFKRKDNNLVYEDLADNKVIIYKKTSKEKIDKLNDDEYDKIINLGE